MLSSVANAEHDNLSSQQQRSEQHHQASQALQDYRSSTLSSLLQENEQHHELFEQQIARDNEDLENIIEQMQKEIRQI